MGISYEIKKSLEGIRGFVSIFDEMQADTLYYHFTTSRLHIVSKNVEGIRGSRNWLKFLHKVTAIISNNSRCYHLTTSLMQYLPGVPGMFSWSRTKRRKQAHPRWPQKTASVVIHLSLGKFLISLSPFLTPGKLTPDPVLAVLVPSSRDDPISHVSPACKHETRSLDHVWPVIEGEECQIHGIRFRDRSPTFLPRCPRASEWMDHKDGCTRRYNWGLCLGLRVHLQDSHGRALYKAAHRVHELRLIPFTNGLPSNTYSFTPVSQASVQSCEV